MIHIFSSFATDIITYDNNRKVPGGPALWMEKTLQDLRVEYNLTTGEPGEVIIEKDGNNQDRGIITQVHEIPFSVPSEGDLLCISTLKNEFPLHRIQKIENTMFLDIQGFLRQDFGGKKRLDCRNLVSKGNIFIKATREEFSYLDHHEDVRCTFIITNGGDSIEILNHNFQKSIDIKSGAFQDTIGAGDTFLSSLCYYFSRGSTIESAVTESGKYTYTFLAKKNIPTI